MLNLTVNGTTYAYPQTADVNWGDGASNWAQAVTQSMLQKSGGLFILSADTDFGANFGLLAFYYKTRTTNTAATGNFRLAKTDFIAWRNNANSADLSLALNGSDQLTFNSATFLTTTGTIVASRAVVTDGSSNIITSAVTATELGYVSGVTSAIQTQLNSKQSTITVLPVANGGTNSSAALTNNKAIISSGGALVESATTSTELGYVHGVTSAIQTQINANSDLGNSYNYLYNSNFDIWQRGTSQLIPNGSSMYLADRWYAVNSLGTTGVVTYSQVAGVSVGSKYGAKVQITAAPTALQSNGCELRQTLENLDSLNLYNQTASFQANIKALGNVTAVGLQFFYATTETKTTTAVGAEVSVSVNTSTFTLGSLLAQALGTSMTTSGVIGVRIRVLSVSTGNTYDLNNGFVVEQAMVTKAVNSTVTYSPKFPSIDSELASCQRYYYVTTHGAGIIGSASTIYVYIPFPRKMRALPSVNGTAAVSMTDITNINQTQSSLNVTANDTGTDSYIIACANFSGLTANRPCFITNAGGAVYFDAEI